MPVLHIELRLGVYRLDACHQHCISRVFYHSIYMHMRAHAAFMPSAKTGARLMRTCALKTNLWSFSYVDADLDVESMSVEVLFSREMRSLRDFTNAEASLVLRYAEIP